MAAVEPEIEVVLPIKTTLGPLRKMLLRAINKSGASPVRLMRRLPYFAVVCGLPFAFSVKLASAIDRQPVSQCHQLTSDPLDYDRLAPAVPNRKVNISKAMTVCEKELRIDPKNRRVLYGLGRLHELKRDIEAAIQFFERASQSEYAAALYVLGGIHINGYVGKLRIVPPNDPLAAKYYEKAAELGHKEAQFQIGHMYQGGVGVKKDINKGLIYMKKAASQNYFVAQFYLGKIFKEGEYVRKNLKEANRWFCKTGKRGMELFKEFYKEELVCSGR